MDAAEKWLRACDPDYATISQTWKHAQTGEYKTPAQEIPLGNSNDLTLLVESGEGQYVEHAAHRSCARCGVAYEPVAARHKYCSAKCREASRGKRDRAAYMRDYRAAQTEVLYDLGANLPKGNPFAASSSRSA